MFIYFCDTHLPYNSPEKFQKKFTAEKKGEKIFEKISNKGFNKDHVDFMKRSFSHNDTLEDGIAKYDSAINYNDYLIERIIKTLKEKKLLENTVIFFFSDHGESLTEHEIYFHHHGPYEHTFHVPLIIFGKELPKNKRVKSFIQHEDITPTIFNILNIKYNPILFDGKSLLPLIYGKKEKIRERVFMEDNSSFKKRIIRTNKYSYMESLSRKDATCKICNNVHQGIIELYDLKKDPEENINIAKKNKKVLKEMKLLLDKTVRDLRNINEKRRINKFLSKI